MPEQDFEMTIDITLLNGQISRHVYPVEPKEPELIKWMADWFEKIGQAITTKTALALINPAKIINPENIVSAEFVFPESPEHQQVISEVSKVPFGFRPQTDSEER